METETQIPAPTAGPSTSTSTPTPTPTPTPQMTTSSSAEKPTAGPSQSATTDSDRKKSTAAAAATALESSDEERGDEKAFECNICLDVAKDAVVSYCGHLFCWPCLHQWLETRPSRQSCPVCKAAISRDKVIPLYGRGGPGVDPRSKIPPRPTPARTEQAEPNRFTWGGGNNDGAGGSFHMSFGIGAFPFGFFASAFNWGQPGGGVAGQNFPNPDQVEEQEFLSKVFLWIALIFMVWLLLA